MANVNPQSENFFYWAPEDLNDYAQCEPDISHQQSPDKRSSANKPHSDKKEYYCETWHICTKKG